VAAGQWPDARLAGRVVGADGLPAAAATVLLAQPDALARWPLALDADGRFAVAGLPAGPYVVEIAAPGTRTVSVPVTVHAAASCDVGVLQTGAPRCATTCGGRATARAD
jgi:hypothetical protein